jgi:hypothetical protein
MCINAFVSARLWLAMGAVVACLMTSGCAGLRYNANLGVSDHNSAMTTGSVIVRPESWRPDSARRERRFGRGGVELSYQSLRADSKQYIDNHEYISFRQPDPAKPDSYLRFDGPQIVSNSTTIDHAHLAYNRLIEFGRQRSVSIELGLGASYNRFTVDALSADGQKLHYTDSNVVFGFGVTPRWRVNQYLTIEAREWLDSNSLYLRADNVSSLAMVFTPVKHVEISAGYYNQQRGLNTDHRPEGNYQLTDTVSSNIIVNVSGPALGLRFVF